MASSSVVNNPAFGGQHGGGGGASSSGSGSSGSGSTGVVDPGMNLGGPPPVTNVPPPSGFGGGTTGTGPGTPQTSDAFAYLTDVLTKYGLGTLSHWAWDQIVAGHTQTEILQMLRDTPEYKTRFAAIIDRQQKGLPPISEQDVVNYESQAGQLFHQAGLPAGFYDSSEDFRKLIAGDVSLTELTARVNDGYARVAASDPSVRDAYQQLFGPSGDAALAAIYLDPDKALPALEQQAAAAEFGGASLTFGFPISRAQAIQAGQLGITQSQARQGFQTLAGERGLFTQTVGEANAARAGATGGQGGVTADQATAAQFGLAGAPAAIQAVDQAQKGRAAAFAGGGGVALGKGGASGLGISEGD